MCYNGILSADWKDGQLDYKSGICSCSNPVGRISRMTKAIYPRSSNDPSEHLVSRFLPQTGKEGTQLDVLNKSEVVDGTRVQGNGLVNGHSYKWRLIIESGVRSVAQVPDRFFDGSGRSYPIDWNSKVSVFNGEAPAYSNFKDAIIYKIDKHNGREKAHPYIIFDAWMDNHSEEDESAEVASFREFLTQYGPNATPDTQAKTDDNKGTLVNTDNNGAIVDYIDDYNPAEEKEINACQYLAIVVDNNNDYHAFVGQTSGQELVDTSADSQIHWYVPKEGVNVDQFKGLDMWIRFESINALTYFILTKYEENIVSIIPAFREEPGTEYGLEKQIRNDTESEWKKDPTYVIVYTYTTRDAANTAAAQANASIPAERKDTERYIVVSRRSATDPDPEAYVNKDTTIIKDYADREAERKLDGALWAYINPRTMKPYDDDYWFHQGEPYYIKSLTIAPKSKKIKGNRITIKADEWPGMYMMIGETYIRSRDTGEDERMQIKIPLCKVRSDQSLTLTADGDPTTFSMTLDVATPKSGVMMELNTYEVATRMDDLGNGCFQAVDGSTQVLTE